MQYTQRRKAILGRLLLKLTKALTPDLLELMARALDGQPILQVVRDQDDLGIGVRGIGDLDWDFLDLGHLTDENCDDLYDYITETRNIELSFKKEEQKYNTAEWNEMKEKLMADDWEGVPYMIIDPPDGEIGVKVSGLVRDMLLANFGTLDYKTCLEFSQMLDDKLMQFDWLELYDGRQFECTFNPAIDGKDSALIATTNTRAIRYCMTQTGDINGGGWYYVYVTRTVDGKTVGGYISGNNGASALYSLCGGHEGYCFSERDVPTRQFNGGRKGLPYLGCTGEDIAAALLKLFNQPEE